MTTVLVLSVAHSIGDARLHRLCRAFCDTGAVVEVHALGDASLSPAGVSTHTFAPSRRPVRMWRALSEPLRRRVDILVVIDPDLAPAALLARALGRTSFVVCDVHEDYEKVVEDREWSSWISRRVALHVARLGRTAAAKANWTIVADEHVSPLIARRRRVVRNLPIRSALQPELPSPTRAVYVGDVRSSRGLSEMVDAVAESPPWELDIIGPVNHRADRERLASAVEHYDRIRSWGRLSPHESWEVARGASVGMSFLSDTPAFRDAIPSKLFQYVNEGMAVVTSPLQRPKNLVERFGMGAVVGSKSELAAQLQAWTKDRSALDACRSAAAAWASANLPADDEFGAVCREIVAIADG